MDIRSGSVKILKHSAKSFLHVIVGSKSISSSFSRVLIFCFFLVRVRDRLSWGSPSASGFNLGAVSLILARPSVAHLCGFMHPFMRSSMQSMHAHRGSSTWCVVWLLFLSRIVILMRSAMSLIPCLFRRHFDAALVRGRGSALRWYHAGRCARMSLESLMAAKLALYFHAVLSILAMSFPSVTVLGPRVGGFHDCREQFVRATLEVPGGAAAVMMMSVTAAQVGRLVVKFRYCLSHIISIASFLALIFRIFSPPSLIGRCSVSIAMRGAFSPSHMRVLIILMMASSMWVGIPCAFVRNCVWPPIIAWIISRFPYSVGCMFSHLLILAFILSNIGSHGAALFTLFPIHAPRILTASPSLAIVTLSSRGLLSSTLIFLVVMILCLCASVPIGIILVFSMLNFAPDTWHQLVRMSPTSSNRSFSLRNRFVSSANKVILTFLSRPGIAKPEPLVLVSALLGQCHCGSAALGGQLWALAFSEGVNLAFVTTGTFRRTR